MPIGIDVIIVVVSMVFATCLVLIWFESRKRPPK